MALYSPVCYGSLICRADERGRRRHSSDRRGSRRPLHMAGSRLPEPWHGSGPGREETVLATREASTQTSGRTAVWSSGLSMFVSVESTTKQACCAGRYTPMRERAERVGVSFNSTPVELRQIVDENSSPGAVTRASVSIHSFQKTRSQTIRRAEMEVGGFDDSDGDDGDPGGEP